MANGPLLQPKLWRTCRVLANRTRLQLLALLLEKPGQTVSTVAACLKRPLPLTSEYLRALEARGLLTVRRVGRRVRYGPGLPSTSPPARRLVAALRTVFRRQANPIEVIFKQATAFTHPRRIQIFRALQAKSHALGQIQSATSIPRRALRRHLKKLQERGFVTWRRGLYAAAKRPDAFGRELARLALR